MPKIPFWIFLIIALLYLSSSRVDIMDSDASQYAEISREMVKNHDYIHLFERGNDYLDKPPLLFWLSSGSMWLFGVNTFAYKLPSLLFALWAIFATYKLGKLLYNAETGKIAALVLATSQGMFLWTNDVRCDTILMSCAITSIWLIKEWETSDKLKYLVYASVFIGMGMLTKGPIALIIPLLCFLPYWAVTKQWNRFLKPQYLLCIAIIGVMLVPMCIGLYQQFDMHPEKYLNGQQSPSGLKFYFWSQSFGRLTGDNPWKNNVDMSFLFQNMLWSYLPWIVFFVPAFLTAIYRLVVRYKSPGNGADWITAGGFLLIYFILGSSAYQLPHYIFVAFPLAAIVNARFFHDMLAFKKYERLQKFLLHFHEVISGLLLLVTLLLITVVFPSGIIAVALWLAGAAVWTYVLVNKRYCGKIIWLPAIAITIVNFFVTNFAYPQLLHYQLGSQVGRYIRENQLPASDIAYYHIDDPLNSLPYYADEVIPIAAAAKSLTGKKYLLTTREGTDSLATCGITADTLLKGPYYKVSELTPEFANPATRSRATKTFYFLKLHQLSGSSVSIF